MKPLVVDLVNLELDNKADEVPLSKFTGQEDHFGHYGLGIIIEYGVPLLIPPNDAVRIMH